LLNNVASAPYSVFRDLNATAGDAILPPEFEKGMRVPHLATLALFAAASACAGVSFVMQQAVNADLRTSLGSAAWAGFASYLGGTFCMLMLALVLRDPLPAPNAISQTNWWAWSGGFFGAVYIAISILLVQRMGAATFIALLVAGQMIASLLFDHFGLFGIPQQAADLPRLFGAILLVGAVVLIRS
jgi:transporter family-2 protein